MDDFTPFGGALYWALCGTLLLARGMDFLSTWIATPNLLLEANPLAKKLGWKLGIILNLIVCGLVPRWPLPAIIIATTSLLVAARNFQSAWLMRTMGETGYRIFMVEQMAQTPRGLYFFCLVAQTALFVLIGSALVYFSFFRQLVPFAVGVGMITYGIAVLFYSLLSVWRIRRSSL